MRAPGQVLLVSCYELGHQPLSLASPLAALAAAGFRPTAVDTSVETLAEAAIRAARLVAISVPMHTAMRLGAEVAGRVRQLNPSAHICLYGLYAWLNAEHILGTDPHPSPLPEGEGTAMADAVIGGEFEQALVALAQSLEHGERAAGVRYADGYAKPVLARQRFPVPVRAGLPGLDRYARLQAGDDLALAGYVEATRGCKHTCSHCPITPVYHGRFFAVPQDVVLADIRQQVRAGARHITFGDPDFLNGPTHSLRIARAMHAEFPDVTFDATIKIEHILRHADVFPELRRLGCVFVVSAVESLSETVLAKLKKGHTAADVDRALDVLSSAGIPPRASLVAFTPWTTLADYLEVLHFVQSRRLVECVDPVQFTIRLLVPPGSALLDDTGADAWLGPLEPADYAYQWKHPDPRMDALHVEVRGIVERAEEAQADVWDTFDAVNAAAHRAAGVEVRPVSRPADRVPPPRLTESWFC